MLIAALRSFLRMAPDGDAPAGHEEILFPDADLLEALEGLERDCGIQLARPAPGGLRLTRAGCVLVREGRQILRLHDEAVRATRAAGERDTALFPFNMLNLPAGAPPPA